MTDYEEIYEVRFTSKETGDEVTDLRTSNKDEAISHRDSLRYLGYKNPHIQHSFENGGVTRDISIDSDVFSKTIISQLKQREYNLSPNESPFAENGIKTSEGNINPPVGFRPDFMKKSVLLGREITLKLPNGETPRGQFAIVELDDILASHNEETFSSTIGYPLDSNGENINDRNYEQDKNAQAKVLEFAQDLQPDRLITTSRTPSGTPVISVDGVVISGNNRTMSIKLAVKQFPEKYGEYVVFLGEEIESFGFKGSVGTQLIMGEKISLPNSSFNEPLSIKFNHPVLVRIDYDVTVYNTMELAKWNKDTKKAEKPIDKAIKLGKILQGSDKCTSIISEIVGRYETFSEFYANLGDQKLLKDTLIDCNILTTQEIPAYFYERGFTESGKELVENLLAGMVLSKESLLASNEGGAKAFRQTIITSLPVLISNLALGEFSLNTYINDALLLQAKMTNSKLSFTDYLVQTNIFDEKTSEWGVYMNRLLASGRNKFKGAIEDYNSSVLENSGESLFGAPPTKEEIFEAHIIKKIEPSERSIIENAYPKGKEKKESEVIEQKTIEPKMETKTLNPFIKGNFFIDHPEKILAEKGTGENWRTKATITTYKGDISNIEGIDADEDFLTSKRESNPIVSVEKETVVQATDSNTEVVDNLVKAITQSDKDKSKKQARKVKAIELSKSVEAVSDNEIVSVAENFKKLSPNIPIEDVMAFLIYQNDRGRQITNEDWIEMTGLNTSELYSHETKLRLVKSGHLNYFDGKLLPSYLYFAENVYDKNSKLVDAGTKTSGNDKDYIVSHYGQDVYDNQVKRMQEVFSKQYQKRLLVQSSGRKDGILILPMSEFAKNFKIKTLDNELPFKWKLVTASTNKRYGQMDLLAVGVSDWDKKEVPELNLTDAFAFWLRTDETIPFHKGISYADVISIYLQAKPKPKSQAIGTKDGSKMVYVGEQLKIKLKEDADWERLKSKTKDEGNRLFGMFLDTQLTALDKVRLENQWNRDFNGYVPIDYNTVPVAFRSNKFFDGSPGDIEGEKREAVAFTFSEGSGLLAYDVGVGKTPSAIFTISQYIDTGWSKRPFLVVPNQTYKQWIAEFKKFAGHIKINEFYNLSSDYISNFVIDGVTKKVEEGSVSIFTYEGMKQLGFNDDTINEMKPNISAILLQESAEDINDSFKKKDKKAEQLNKKVEELIGRALSKTIINIEDLGFDFVCFDEAHACKKVFTFVKGSSEKNTSVGGDEKEGRSVNEYEITSGQPSLNGIKGFMLTHYIQTKYFGNTLLLTATPFTNSPLEIYSMLSMIAFNKLRASGMENIKTFFDTFVNVSYEMIINSKLRPQRKQVIMGFNNLIPLQTLIRRFINYKDGDSIESIRKKRPNKVVLPLRQKMVDGILMQLNEDERKDTVLPFTPLQDQLMEQIKEYANGNIGEDILCSGGAHIDDLEDGADISEGVELDEDSLDASEKAGVRTLKALSHARNLALSPYIFDCSGLGTPDYLSYIETSNKLKYVMECVASIKKHHAENNQSMSGVIIYMDRGKAYFPLVKEYLVKIVGFKEHEIGIMSSGLMEPTEKGLSKEDQKEYIKNLFLGLKYNEATQEVEAISDEQRVKVVIGSSMIREGINLQAHTSTLFNCWLDWNPSDQKQLYGRLFRQGNKFKNIRIVVPLMIDSIDIFMFQKLEEKTSRINSIWDTDGHSNAFNTEEFDPSQLKRVLIKNPKVVAEIELMEVSEKADEDISDVRNEIKRLEKVSDYEGTIKNYEDDLEKWLDDYRPNRSGNKRSVETNVALAIEVLRKQTDSKGKPMVDRYKQTPQIDKKTGDQILDYYSDHAPAVRQYWFNDLALAVRSLKKEVKNYLEPNGISISNIPKFIEKKKSEVEKLIEDKTKLTDENAINKRAEEIMEERERTKFKLRELPDVVDDFTEMNYLLNEIKVPQVKVEISKESTCPPVDEKGIVRIDSDALKQLDECNNSLTQTKRLNSTEDNETGERVYTEKRKELHTKIINTFTKDAVCIGREQPIAILTGGAPGSGKSAFLRKFAPYLTSDKIIKIDADEIRAMLPEYKGWNANQTHEETKDVVNYLLNTFDQPCKHDLLYDGTMSNANKYFPLIDKLKLLGYKVFVAYMEVPLAVSKERALNRYKDNKGSDLQYGRYVPMGVIDDFFKSGEEGFNIIKKKVDGYVKVDGLTQEIIEQGGEKIPTDRDYSAMFEKSTGPIVVPETTVEPTKADFLASISGTKVALKYADDSEKKALRDYMKGLQVTIKYL